MPSQPAQQDVHVDAVLTNISIAYMQGTEGFVSTKVFPVIPTDKQTNTYFIYNKNDWFRDEAQRRADSTESAGSGYNLSRDFFGCEVYAFHKDVGDQVVANSDNPLSPDRDATQFVSSRLLLRQEIQWSTDYFKTGVWATDMVGVASAPSASQFIQWSNYTTSTPIDQIEAAKEGIVSTTGFMPNTLVLGYQVMRQLKHHPDIRDRFKYTSSMNITAEILARLFEVDKVLVAWGVKATNLEGETSAYAFITGKSALLTYSNPSPGLLAPSAGYVFQWNGVSEGMGASIGVSKFRMPALRSNRIEGQTAWKNNGPRLARPPVRRFRRSALRVRR